MNWTQRHDDLLRRHPGLDDDSMAERIGTTARSVAERRLALGIRKNAKGGWTDERVAELKRLHNDGNSAREIARQMGGVSRSAVIGKMHRLGLNHPDQEAMVREGHRVSRKTATKNRKPPPPTEAARAFQHGSGCITGVGPKTPRDTRTAGPTPQSLNIRMWDERFTGHCCRWATKEDATGHFFCAAPALPDMPYCEAHDAAAYRPTPKPPSTVKDSAPRTAETDDDEPKPLDFGRAA